MDFRPSGEIVLGDVVGVQRQVGFDPLETRNHAGEGADVLLETRHCARGRNAAVAAAGHDQLVAGLKLDGHWRATWIAQLLLAASRTLRAGRDEMLDDARAHQVEAHNVIAQIGAELGGDRFGDFDRRQLNAGLSERMPGERRGGDAVRVPAIEQRLDLAVARHAIGETHPAGAVARDAAPGPPREKCRRAGPAATACDRTNVADSTPPVFLRDSRSPT